MAEYVPSQRSSIKGLPHLTGRVSSVDGATGIMAQPAIRGYSAYDLAVQEGYQGTLEEWLDSLRYDHSDEFAEFVEKIAEKYNDVLGEHYAITEEIEQYRLKYNQDKSEFNAIVDAAKNEIKVEGSLYAQGIKTSKEEAIEAVEQKRIEESAKLEAKTQEGIKAIQEEVANSNTLAEQYANQASESSAIALAAAEEAEGYAKHSPILSENNTWMTWDGTKYVDTGVIGEGTKGEPGEVDYSLVYNKDEVDALVENAGKVKTVNGEEPDEDGNIEIDVPTLTSQLTNDSGFLTEHQDISHLATKEELSQIPKFDTKVVDELPTEDISTDSVYLVPSDGEDDNLYSEYINVNGAWELLGSQKVDVVQSNWNEEDNTQPSYIQNIEEPKAKLSALDEFFNLEKTKNILTDMGFIEGGDSNDY